MKQDVRLALYMIAGAALVTVITAVVGLIFP